MKYYFPASGFGFWYQLGVLEKFQRQGIGEKLLRLSINHAIQLGSNKIILECRKSNISFHIMFFSVFFHTHIDNIN